MFFIFSPPVPIVARLHGIMVIIFVSLNSLQLNSPVITRSGGGQRGSTVTGDNFISVTSQMTSWIERERESPGPAMFMVLLIASPLDLTC